jgi:hypothetical protein
MRHREIIPTDDHQTGQPNRRVAAQINLTQGHCPRPGGTGNSRAVPDHYHSNGHHHLPLQHPPRDEWDDTGIDVKAPPCAIPKWIGETKTMVERPSTGLAAQVTKCLGGKVSEPAAAIGLHQAQCPAPPSNPPDISRTTHLHVFPGCRAALSVLVGRHAVVRLVSPGPIDREAKRARTAGAAYTVRLIRLLPSTIKVPPNASARV